MWSAVDILYDVTRSNTHRPTLALSRPAPHAWMSASMHYGAPRKNASHLIESYSTISESTNARTSRTCRRGQTGIN